MVTKDKSKPVKGEQQSVDKVVDHVKRLPRNEQHQVMQKLEMFSGPIPAPHILKQYDEMIQGPQSRLLIME